MSSINSKIPVGILGATGMVGQRFITLLESHPWFHIACIAASNRSKGKTYREAVKGRWSMNGDIPTVIGERRVLSVEDDMMKIAGQCSLVFCAIDADKKLIRQLENEYAAQGLAVVSNNSAHRWTDDVPMIMPEINPHHLDIITDQRSRRGWNSGLIVVKPNCSIQSYVPLLEAWKTLEPEKVIVSTYQAISGAGKSFSTWPEMQDNVIPYIGGEEEKSEKEPLKIWGHIVDGVFERAHGPDISAQCIRVPVSDGHMASIHVSFKNKTTASELIQKLNNFQNPLEALNLPSAPDPFITYFNEDNRPQTGLDRDIGQGMGVAVGRLRPDNILDWKCVALSHNTIRGAAGGSVLNAELLVAKGFVNH
jgi:aspartate-semialdehyde dehydrogenase